MDNDVKVSLAALSAVLMSIVALLIGQHVPDPGLDARSVDAWSAAGYLPCVDESAQNAPCYWDAKARGNGEGTSFLVTDDGETFYPDGSSN